MKLMLIRHGATEGNAHGRYIGTTDEQLSNAGREALARAAYPPADIVFVSPMRRALETAQILFPDAEKLIVPGFRECDFGVFENRNHLELMDEPRYQQWIDSGGELPFPGGESRERFFERTLLAFDEILPLLRGSAAIVAHGGTLMAIMSGRGIPVRDYYDYQAKNGCGYSADVVIGAGTLYNIREIGHSST